MDHHRLPETARFVPPIIHPYMQHAIPHQMPYNAFPMMSMACQQPPPPVPPYAPYNTGLPMPHAYFPPPTRYEYPQQNMGQATLPPNYNLNNFFNPLTYEAKKEVPVTIVNTSNEAIHATYPTTDNYSEALSSIDTGPNESNETADSSEASLTLEGFENYLNDIAKCLNSSEIPQTKFEELSYLALKGCAIAEKLASVHRNRPCFKKIDSLCARLKHDIKRPDSVLPNINSQGIAWAVKDFIFVFTRILNAWVILKGYVYHKTSGLNHIKSALSDDFMASFAVWQDSTLSFTANLIKSFISLDNLVHTQRNNFHKPKEDEKMSEKSENSLTPNQEQVNSKSDGIYLKIGTYNPLQKIEGNTEMKAIASPDTSGCSSLSDTGHNLKIANNLSQNMYDACPTKEFKCSVHITPPTSTPIRQKEKIPPNWLDYEVRVLVKDLTEFSTHFDPRAPPEKLNGDFIDQVNILIQRVMQMKYAEYFFDTRWTTKYFPDFFGTYQHQFKDLRTIIHCCQVGGYKHLHDVIYDIKLIPFLMFSYLRNHINPKLYEVTTLFDKELSEIFKQQPFDKYEFDYVSGVPYHFHF